MRTPSSSCSSRMRRRIARGVRQPLGIAQGGQVGQADRHQHAVQRLPPAVLLQHAQEAEPGGGIDRGVAVLRRVASGGIDQHGLVGEPPVAVARAADTADAVRGALPGLVGEREVQAAIDQRGGLAGAGRADEHVPGKLVQIAARAACRAWPSSARPAPPSAGRPAARSPRPRRSRSDSAPAPRRRRPAPSPSWRRAACGSGFRPASRRRSPR